jgi:NAD(P)-dependent dehydrogenase (short-subunit alcohol dehydrogenase family)
VEAAKACDAAARIRRLIEAEEIAAQVALLASPLGAITNGAAVRVKGGIIPTIA